MEDFLELRLETETLEEILETYDLGPLEVLMELFDTGKIRQDYPEEGELEYD